jgi:hypothetical protein
MSDDLVGDTLFDIQARTFFTPCWRAIIDMDVTVEPDDDSVTV